jgi:Na+/melibiose symporter-like transporter
LLAGPDLTPAAFVVAIGLHGVGTGGVFTLIWTLASDAADRTVSSGGAVFGLVIMVMQVASGLGTGVVAMGLAAADYAPDAPAGGATFMALAAFTIAPALAGIAAVALLHKA